MPTYHTKDILQKKYREIASLSANLSEDSLHEFRLAVKKLRAYVRLLTSGKKRLEHLPRPLQTYYRMAGMLRSLQLQRSSLLDVAAEHQIPLPASATAFLNGKIETAAALLLLNFSENKSMLAGLKEFVESLPASITDVAVQNYLRRKLRYVNSLKVGTLFKEEDYHELRKVIKDILYILPLLKVNQFENLKAPFELSEASMKLLSDLLGRYRDLMLLITLLSDPLFLDALGPGSEALAQQISDAWRSKKPVLLSEIEKCLYGLEEKGAMVSNDTGPAVKPDEGAGRKPGEGSTSDVGSASAGELPILHRRAHPLIDAEPYWHENS